MCFRDLVTHISEGNTDQTEERSWKISDVSDNHQTEIFYQYLHRSIKLGVLKVDK